MKLPIGQLHLNTKLHPISSYVVSLIAVAPGRLIRKARILNAMRKE